MKRKFIGKCYTFRNSKVLTIRQGSSRAVPIESRPLNMVPIPTHPLPDKNSKLKRRFNHIEILHLLHTALRPVWTIPTAKHLNSKYHYKLCKISFPKSPQTSTWWVDFHYPRCNDTHWEICLARDYYHKHEHIILNPA